MKLREYGFIIWKLSGSSTLESQELGDLAWSLRELVEDWQDDNSVNEGQAADWLREDYKSWEHIQQQKIIADNRGTR